MEIFQAVLHFISSIAWPLTVLAGLGLFRSEIADLLAGFSEFLKQVTAARARLGGFEVDLRDEEFPVRGEVEPVEE